MKQCQLITCDKLKLFLKNKQQCIMYHVIRAEHNFRIKANKEIEYRQDFLHLTQETYSEEEFTKKGGYDKLPETLSYALRGIVQIILKTIKRVNLDSVKLKVDSDVYTDKQQAIDRINGLEFRGQYYNVNDVWSASYSIILEGLETNYLKIYGVEGNNTAIPVKIEDLHYNMTTSAIGKFNEVGLAFCIEIGTSENPLYISVSIEAPWRNNIDKDFFEDPTYIVDLQLIDEPHPLGITVNYAPKTTL